MSVKKVRVVKGMTILENIIAFTLIIAALTIAGTGFYTSGIFINKGNMYNDAADEAQKLMESGVFDDVISAFKEGRIDGNNRFDSDAMQKCMRSVSPGYRLSSDRSYYYNDETWVVIKPFSSSDGNLSYASADIRCVAASENTGREKLDKLPGIYIYICVPVNRDEINEYKKQGRSDIEAIGISDYVPLVYYVGEWSPHEKEG